MRTIAFVLGLILALHSAGMAQESDTAAVLRADLYAGSLADGLAEMEARAAEGDAEAAFGAGFLIFLTGVEDFAQAMLRHGFDPERGIVVSPFMGAFSPPEAPQRPAAPLDYAQLRSHLDAFVAAMDSAHEQLVDAAVQDGAPVEIDVMRIRFDLDGDGVGDDQGTVGAILNQAASLGGALGADAPAELPEAVFAFDAADAIWLAGYSQVLAAQADFLLAHDFEMTFNAAMHRVFPGAGLPMDNAGRGSIMSDPETDMLMADAIAGVHTLNWPVVDRARLTGVQDRLFEIVSLSRRNWEAIIAETDDHLEFMPAPAQTPVHEDMRITKPMVSAWLETLDAFEAIVSGELLLPHWRFPERGFDLDAYFTEAERTDAVMILTGYGALPFMREGTVAGPEHFEAANAVFGNAIWGYAFWFN
ncbi:hypothetical protein [Pelagibacterium xiamenense]|uniref:hypothetical protein n=1 Tax=Pelagibacterium xiamenense TaxID=2901140 RepID=UPI001E3A5D30|nr:hypothetical protein [Pelagibacterium xiamenense]MCD7060115.1 hypothetical protein [Pelagibacterium xiamenense]